MKRLLYIILLAFLLTACGKAETNNKKEQVETKQTEESSDNQVDNTESSEEKDEDSQSTVDVPIVQEPSNQAESNENQSSKNESTGNSNTTTGSNNSTTTKPSTGNTNNSGSGNTGNSNSGSNNTGSTNPNTGSTNNSNPGTTTQPVHEHNWTEVVEEEIHYYAWRTICGKCESDLTDMTGTDRAYHVTVVCSSRYGTVYKEVDFVTENVVKTPVVTGYKCSCGETKEK